MEFTEMDSGSLGYNSLQTHSHVEQKGIQDTETQIRSGSFRILVSKTKE